MVRMVIIGDTHTGSRWGLNDKEYPEPLSCPFSPWIRKSWEHFATKYHGPDYLITIGDLPDGSQNITLGVDAVVTSTDEQVEMSARLLKMMLTKKTRVFGINGSGYHGGERQGTNMDRRIIESIGGEYKGDVFEFDVGSDARERIQVAHGGGGASVANPSAYILREIRLLKEDSVKRKSKMPTILIRGHQHRFFMLQDDAGVWGVLNGCWEYTTPFMFKKSANITPSFGGVIIDVVDDEPTKIYREEYVLPDEVRMEMNGYEVFLEKERKKMETARRVFNYKARIDVLSRK